MFQITLKNPFAQAPKPPRERLIARLSPGPCHLVEFAHEGPIGRDGGLIATLTPYGGPALHLTIEVEDDPAAQRAANRTNRGVSEKGQADQDAGQVNLLYVGVGRILKRRRLLERGEGPLTWEQVLSQPMLVHALAEFRRCAARGRLSRLVRLFWPAWIFAAAALVFGAATVAFGLAPLAPSAPTAAAATALPGAQDVLDSREREILARVVAQAGIAMDPRVSGKPFVVLSDPNCPACQRLEGTLQALDKKKFTPIVLPIAFKDGSVDKVSGVLCASDIGRAWTLAIGGGEPGPACERGRQQAQSNNAAFVALRLNSTPTIVAPNGRVIAGTASVDQLIAWLNDNSSGK